MKKQHKTILIIALVLITGGISAQDTMYVHQSGGIVTKFAVAKIDSLVFKPSTQILTDIAGNIYNTVTIGNQKWMAENLRTPKYNDGQVIPLVKDNTQWQNLTTGGYCWYNNDSAAYEKSFGKVYNWHAVGTGKLCPQGWHVPTDDDWMTLQNYLIINNFNFDGTTIENKIAKSMAAKTNWIAYTGGGTPGNDLSTNNKSGFNGLPGGYRAVNGSFNYIGLRGHWWTSTAQGSSLAWNRYLYNTEYFLGRDSRDKENGFNVRCIKD